MAKDTHVTAPTRFVEANAEGERQRRLDGLDLTPRELSVIYLLRRASLIS